MVEVGQFPDVVDVACDLAEEFLGQGRAFGELPEEAGSLLPVAWCFKVGGGCEDGVTDKSIVAIQVIAKTLSDARRISGEIRERVLTAGGTAVNGVLVDSTREQGGIRLQPAPNPGQPMITATYELSFRRQR